MTYNFCTLFDKNYLYRGLALYDSIVKYCPDFYLYILCVDEETFDALGKLSLKNTKLIPLKDVEYPRLLEAKKNRTRQEYAWTLGSVFTNYVIKNNPALSDIAYLDSDIYFYSSPQPLYDELGADSVLIIKHNYEKNLKYLEARSGIYNVALVIFKNNEAGNKVLTEWSDNCVAWCFNKYEEGRFGDQMYLDKWPETYAGICVSKNDGADVAPWNMNSYKVSSNDKNVLIDGKPLIFYHTHTLKIISPDKYELYSSFYKFDSVTEKLIYGPYTDNLNQVINRVKEVDSSFNFGYRLPENFKDKIKQRIKRLLVWLYYSHKKYETT